jgi:hypothetical protein
MSRNFSKFSFEIHFECEEVPMEEVDLFFKTFSTIFYFKIFKFGKVFFELIKVRKNLNSFEIRFQIKSDAAAPHCTIRAHPSATPSPTSTPTRCRPHKCRPSVPQPPTACRSGRDPHPPSRCMTQSWTPPPNCSTSPLPPLKCVSRYLSSLFAISFPT